MSDSNNSYTNPFTIIISILTARIGYFVNWHLGSNHPFFWAVIDFIAWPFAWIKWIICQDVSLAIIKEAFSFFF